MTPGHLATPATPANPAILAQKPAEGIRPAGLPSPHRTEFFDWFAPGEARSVWIGDVEVVVRFVERKGRRARIAVIRISRSPDPNLPS